jgi:hypothetical protein
LNNAFDDIVLVIETFGFRICFGFGASDFEFAGPAITQKAKICLHTAGPGKEE